MTRVRLVLMLYFFMVAHKAACQVLSKAFLKSKQRIRKMKICSVVLLPALTPACSLAMIFSACGFSLFSLIFSMTLLG